MAITAVTNLVQIRAGNVDTTTATLPSSVTTGDLLVVAGGVWHAGTNATLAVSKNSGTATLGTMTTLLGPTGIHYAAGDGQGFISYGFVTGDGSLEILLDPAQSLGNYIAAGTILFRGVNSTPLDVDGGEALPGSTSTPTDTITTINANALIVGVVLIDGVSGTWTPGSGYTQIDEDETATYQAFNAEYKIVTTATTYNVDWTLNTARTVEIYDAAFMPASAASIVMDRHLPQLAPLLAM